MADARYVERLHLENQRNFKLSAMDFIYIHTPVILDASCVRHSEWKCGVAFYRIVICRSNLAAVHYAAYNSGRRRLERQTPARACGI